MENQPSKRKFSKAAIALSWGVPFVLNALQYKTSDSRFFRSMLTSLYVTLRCDLKCSYCHYHEMKQLELDTDGMYKLLEKIRPKNPSLNITGGEPLVRNDIVDILRRAKELEFAPIILNTNASLWDSAGKDRVLDYADYAIVSLDCVDDEKWDRILGRNGASKRIKANIAKYASQQESRGFRIGINTVITPDSIDDFYGVLEFCDRLDLPVSPVPQDDGKKPHKDLVSNPKYRELIRNIIELKKQGRNIVASDSFLEMILNFPAHNCYPSLVPRIYPDGSVFYPCQPLGTTCGKLQDFPGNLYEMLKEQYKKEGLPPCAKDSKNCFMSCYQEFVNVTKRPGDVFKEHFRRVK